ncbi:MAG: methylated-DNA--[protein]-cysteine S-methyltransferase, partial [Deltaproteobacteria bacterium]|nr:methylated-DNA--[protein]-cysteine S-methyltransferase [Deltaproteobacteria bacterium]
EKFTALLEGEFNPAAIEKQDCEILERAEEQLRDYFEGRRRRFQIPLELNLGGFARKVLGAVARIPYGKVVTYGHVARRVGNPRACRAVGVAVGANPLPLVIPCHRVVAKSGLGGFGPGVEIKRTLLELEGAL